MHKQEKIMLKKDVKLIIILIPSLKYELLV